MSSSSADASKSSSDSVGGPLRSAPEASDGVAGLWLARVLLVLSAGLPAVLVAALLGEGPLVYVALGLWSAVSLHRTVGTRAVLQPTAQLASDLRVAVAFGGTVALAAVLGLFPIAAARGSLLVMGVAAFSMTLVRLARPREPSTRRVVLVGSQRDVEDYATVALGPDLVAGCLILDSRVALAVPPTLLVPTTTSLPSLAGLVSAVDADAVLVLPGPDVTAEVVRDLTWLFRDSDVSIGVVCPVSPVSAHRARTTVSGTSTVLELGSPRALPLRGRAAVDRLCAAALLVLGAPLLVVLWVAVRLDSKGPGFFVQTRMGPDGRPFGLVKLRTMHRGAGSLREALVAESASDTVLFTVRRDPRVTRVGYWLRRFSLDELPRLVNVLRGEMSLIGPRPARPDELGAADLVGRTRRAW